MPSKHKKPKHKHPSSNNNGGGGGGELTHDEIWDDSALIRSWDAAVKEYEYYHSLAAQGLDVEAVLDAAEEAEGRGEEVPLALDGAGDGKGGAVNGTSSGEIQPVEEEEGEVEDGELEEGEEREPTAKERAEALRRAGLVEEAEVENAAVSRHEGTQQHAEATSTASPTQEETLENLKMAYYWAGYYSGLYDQQRQRQQQQGKEAGGG